MVETNCTLGQLNCVSERGKTLEYHTDYSHVQQNATIASLVAKVNISRSLLN